LTVSLVLTRRLLRPLEPSTDPAETSAHASAYHVPALESPEIVLNWLFPVLDYLESSRPTAVNLQEGMDRIRKTARDYRAADGSDPVRSATTLSERIVETCQAIEKEDLERCKEMSKKGAEWLVEKIKKEKNKDKLKVMTVCNTGSLATSGYGTALGVITALHESGHLDRAYYTQSTPYHQGSRLTSLELSTLQIPSCMICDTMVGSLFQHEDVDAVIVGADRIVANGDTANKVRTLVVGCLLVSICLTKLTGSRRRWIDRDVSSGFVGQDARDRFHGHRSRHHPGLDQDYGERVSLSLRSIRTVD
jgi:methylthioribose-1-phosphate isomerase